MKIIRKKIDYELTTIEKEKFIELYKMCDEIETQLATEVKVEEQDEINYTILDYLTNISMNIIRFLEYMGIDYED